MDNENFEERKDIFKKNIIKITGETKQNRIAEKLNVSESKLSRWFAGNLMPTLYDLLNISEEYDCSIDWLIGNNRNSSNGFSVYDICKILVDIDTEVGFCQKSISDERLYDEHIDFAIDPQLYVQTECCGIYFPDIIEKNSFEHSYAGNEINKFLKKYAGLKQAHSQGLIDNDIFRDAVNAQLKKLDHDRITFEYESDETSKTSGIDYELPFN